MPGASIDRPVDDARLQQAPDRTDFPGCEKCVCVAAVQSPGLIPTNSSRRPGPTRSGHRHPLECPQLRLAESHGAILPDRHAAATRLHRQAPLGTLARMASEHWPLSGLEVRTPRLTLRYLDDELADQVIAVALRGVHDPATMPFSIPWTDLPSPEMEQEALRFYWSSPSEHAPRHLAPAPCRHRRRRRRGFVSTSFATDFPALRQFETGSWLGREYQGQGIGKEMRLAALTLGFDGLGAEVATTGLWHDNAASLGVTTSLGYEQIGRRRALRRGEPDETDRLPHGSRPLGDAAPRRHHAPRHRRRPRPSSASDRRSRLGSDPRS